jgi:hypothetical protein
MSIDALKGKVVILSSGRTGANCKTQSPALASLLTKYGARTNACARNATDTSPGEAAPRETAAGEIRQTHYAFVAGMPCRSADESSAYGVSTTPTLVLWTEGTYSLSSRAMTEAELSRSCAPRWPDARRP